MKLDELEVLLNNAEAYRQNQHEYDASQRLREAVLGQQARIAELESQLAFERERYELLAMDYAGADADRKAQPPAPDPGDRVRIAELESAVQHADKVVEQLTTERDAALELAGRERNRADTWQIRAQHAETSLETLRAERRRLIPKLP